MLSSLTNFVIIKLTLCLIVGIIIGDKIDISTSQSVVLSLNLISLLALFLLIYKSSYKRNTIIGVLIFLSSISIGILTITLHDQSQFKNHYSNIDTVNIYDDNIIQFQVEEVLKPGFYQDKYSVRIHSINSEPTIGKVLLNIIKDSLMPVIKVDDIYATKTSFHALPSPLNPHQFNYKSYLNKQYIYNEFNLGYDQLFKIHDQNKTLKGIAASFREHIITKLDFYNFEADALAIINALLLGQRQDISKEIYTSYVNAGAIHILAVSGLHVGILLIFLNTLFKPLELFRNGKFLKIILIILLMWNYALIAGLSASVVRAVTMFSLFAIAMNLKRPTNVYNTLAISAFVLLLFHPNFIFEVGFQLSYLAVLAIVSIEPLLSKIYQPKNQIINFFWRILTVTISAQIGVLPISLFYFHQFPALFFISNLVIIPVLGIILGLGILIIILGLLDILPTYLSTIYQNVIQYLNVFVGWISDQESFLFQNISFGLVDVIFSYTIISLAILVNQFKSFRSMFLLLVTIIGFQCYLITLKKTSGKTEFIIFHKNRSTIIGLKTGKNLVIHHDEISDSLLGESLIVNYQVNENLESINVDPLESVYNFKTKKMLVIDSLGIFKVKTFKPDLILLRNSPKINLNRIIDSLNPELIISDGSNFKSYQERWALSCEAKNIPFHQTSKKGAFIYRY